MNEPITLLEISSGHQEPLATLGTFPEQTHVFDADSIHAVNAALASRRPLLVRGEPGIGKSQLARATAKVLRRPYIEQVVDARTESRDLLWYYDAVARLSEAQLSGALGHRDDGARRRLAVRNYVRPGPLWWAFDWADALRQAVDVGAPAPPSRPTPTRSVAASCSSTRLTRPRARYPTACWRPWATVASARWDVTTLLPPSIERRW
jgi:hypothetical protein